VSTVAATAMSGKISKPGRRPMKGARRARSALASRWHVSADERCALRNKFKNMFRISRFLVSTRDLNEIRLWLTIRQGAPCGSRRGRRYFALTQGL
jgi:hypothetical protein